MKCPSLDMLLRAVTFLTRFEVITCLLLGCCFHTELPPTHHLLSINTLFAAIHCCFSSPQGAHPFFSRVSFGENSRFFAEGAYLASHHWNKVVGVSNVLLPPDLSRSVQLMILATGCDQRQRPSPSCCNVPRI